MILLIGLNGCSSPGVNEKNNQLIIFHAGSLTKPFAEIATAFESEHPGVKVLTEAAGSRECARKISELHKPCDIIAVADYAVIETLLMPEFTDHVIAFAQNEMCIAFTDRSRFNENITPVNWYHILLKDSVAFGRSDPNTDPCGYRTLMMFQLAEKYYGIDGLSGQLSQKDQKYIRPKEVDLIALLEARAIDYMVIYTSVAEQHHLGYIELPDEINLSNSAMLEFYATSAVELSGKTKDETIIRRGEPMIYGVSLLNNAPNPELALEFLEFLLAPEKGLKIMQRNGQPTITDSQSVYFDNFPEVIQNQLKNER